MLINLKNYLYGDDPGMSSEKAKRSMILTMLVLAQADLVLAKAQPVHNPQVIKVLDQDIASLKQKLTHP